MVKKVVLNSFDDLIEVFPNMTLSQIISIYKQVQRALENIREALEICTIPSRRKELESEFMDCMKADAFLSTYLARYCCKMNGF